MKKYIIAFCVGFVATAVNASYLYWQVDESNYSGLENYAEVAGARVAYNGSSSSGTLTSWYTAMNESSGESEWTQSAGSGVIGQLYAADVSTYAGSGYSYYIELVNNAGNVVARSTNALVWNSSDYTTYTQNAATTAELPTSNIEIWHGSPYTAVPEPTSAILMMFGMAFLGLKRKNRRIA